MKLTYLFAIHNINVIYRYPQQVKHYAPVNYQIIHLQIRLVFVSSILVAVSSLPHSYHHVKFITPSERLESSPWKPVIPPRSYSYSWSSGPSPANRLWSVGNFHLPAFPSIGHQFEFPHVGQAPQGFFGQQQQLQPNFNNEIGKTIMMYEICSGDKPRAYRISYQLKTSTNENF